MPDSDRVPHEKHLDYAEGACICMCPRCADPDTLRCICPDCNHFAHHDGQP